MLKGTVYLPELNRALTITLKHTREIYRNWKDDRQNITECVDVDFCFFGINALGNS